MVSTTAFANPWISKGRGRLHENKSMWPLLAPAQCLKWEPKASTANLTATKQRTPTVRGDADRHKRTNDRDQTVLLKWTILTKRESI
ncbi:hypothetical protein OPV22_004241 [Ensete ventricosum]|uniref:Uncharacterized protein n=1 Tax=Ensete ventricosum TaxID=4639 RepID=A0AAV8S2W7_ENSVE|nr:hypothetical protein OPV22_004241 [Ensete ventricosum]